MVVVVIVLVMTIVWWRFVNYYLWLRFCPIKSKICYVKCDNGGGGQQHECWSIHWFISCTGDQQHKHWCVQWLTGACLLSVVLMARSMNADLFIFGVVVEPKKRKVLGLEWLLPNASQTWISHERQDTQPGRHSIMNTTPDGGFGRFQVV